METKIRASVIQHCPLPKAKQLGFTQHIEHKASSKRPLPTRTTDELERGRSRQVIKLWWVKPAPPRPAS